MNSIGVDEVGRGCWAGPLVAGAVRLHRHIEGLDDSKKLSKNRRSDLSAQIYKNADVGLGWVTAQEVDLLGLTEAVRLAMQRAVIEIHGETEDIIVDGAYNFLSDFEGTRAIVRADGEIAQVSAASIVAKVARDSYMERLDGSYAKWQFSSHVGYGTAKHIALLKEHGISDIHRLSYKPIKKIMQERQYIYEKT